MKGEAGLEVLGTLPHPPAPREPPEPPARWLRVGAVENEGETPEINGEGAKFGARRGRKQPPVPPE